MLKPRTLLFTLFSLSSVALLLSSCDGDDDTIGTSGGSGGTSASGGDAGTGGTGNRGGTGGGTGGASGSGTAEGGAGAGHVGGGGAGARSGNGGTLSIGGAGSPGAAGNTPGGGGNGAEAGADQGGAGAGGAASEQAPICQTGCATSEDCASPSVDGRCDETLHLCVECTADTDCAAKANGWNSPCTSDADCSDVFLTACVELNGSGRCAAPPKTNGECRFGEIQSYPRFGVEPVELTDICVVDSGRCNAQHRCIIGCTDAPDFCTSVSQGHGDTCNETTGLCQCESDDECTAGAPHCNLTTHQCDECETADDCADAPTGHECHEGRCGCSSTSACSDGSFPDGTPLCK